MENRRMKSPQLLALTVCLALLGRSAAAASNARSIVMSSADKNSIAVASNKNELQLLRGDNLSGIPLRIYDITGRQVLQVKPVSNRINIAGLLPGVYVLVYTKNGKQVSARFVK